jgi:hypothetical protein
MKTYIYLGQYLAEVLEWELFQTKVVEKIKTHVLCSAIVSENRAVYVIKWKNMVEPGRPQMKI